MKIAPIILSYGKNNAISTKGQGVMQNKARQTHNYTGNPCQDLAYASMFDKKIARDLKLMGLI